MNVILSGLTGAGKSSLSQSVADGLGRTRVSGSAIRHRLIVGAAGQEGTEVSREFWLSSTEAIAADRERMRDARVDRDLDEELVRIHDHRTDVVFDAWFMAWRVRRPSLRVWLEASLDVRVERVARDLGPAGAARDVTASVTGKDERSRAFGLHAYSIDVFTDRSPFDVVLANGRDLPFPSAVAILCGLAAAAGGGRRPPLAGETLAAAKAGLLRCPGRLASAIGIGSGA